MAPDLVFVHGFTQTPSSWAPVAEHLAAPTRSLAVPEGDDFVTVAHALDDGVATYVGYSQGGRLCLQLALDRPATVSRLVLVSASPGIADPGERAARRADDERLAQEIERDGVDAFLDRWLDQPLFASLPRDVARVDERRRTNTVDRITHQLRALGQGVQPSLWDRLPQLTMPVTLVTGAYDRKYTELATRMAAAIGDGARAVVIPGAGHALHLEQPDALAAVLRDG